MCKTASINGPQFVLVHFILCIRIAKNWSTAIGHPVYVYAYQYINIVINKNRKSSKKLRRKTIRKIKGKTSLDRKGREKRIHLVSAGECMRLCL